MKTFTSQTYKVLVILSLSAALLSGCQRPPSTVSAISTPGNIHTSDLTNTAELTETPKTASPEITSTTKPPLSETLTPTQTIVLSPTITSTPHAIQTSDPLTNIMTQCSEVAPSFPDNLQPKGYIVLKRSTRLYLYNLETETNVEIGHDIFGAILSPDQKYIFYKDCIGIECTHYIADVNGVINSSPSSDEWYLDRWVDNTHIEFHHSIEPYNSILILNPFTEEKEILSLDLPNAYHTPGIDHPWFNNAIDATRERIIYFDTEGIGRVILWDIPSSKILAWLPYPVPEGKLPGIYYDYLNGWSPDNSQFVINSPVGDTIATDDGNPAVEELFTISRDGQAEQLTHLSNKYLLTRFYDMSWSPDGRYIAFWVSLSENKDDVIGDLPVNLMILDMKTKEVIDYCITSLSPSTLSWSADSKQIVVGRVIGQPEAVYILNRTANLLEKVNSMLAPQGWMIAP
jgi:hypothetical protein